MSPLPRYQQVFSMEKILFLMPETWEDITVFKQLCAPRFLRMRMIMAYAGARRRHLEFSYRAPDFNDSGALKNVD